MKPIYILILCSLLGCATQTPETKISFEPSALQYLREYKADCDKEASVTWGLSLCVPLIILDRDNMNSVTSEVDPEGKFIKIEDGYKGAYYGDPVYANTSIQWGGRAWSMVLWPLPKHRVERTQLMFHEAFHSIQERLGLPMNGAVNSHLDKESARVLVRLEWNALLRALIDEKQRYKHLQVALQLRALRFSKFPRAKQNEEALEINEALAEYTGVKLRGSSYDETLAYLNRRLENIPKIFSLTRSSAYYSGPLYGLLFDTQSKDWKSILNKHRTFMTTAEKVFNIKIPKTAKPLQASQLELYGNAEIVKFERQRALETNTKIAKYLKQIHQPKKVEMFFQNPQMIYNPYGMLAVSGDEKIYTTYELRDVWGELGAYLKKNKKSATITVSPPLEITDDTAKGNEWTLKLNPGWKLVKKKDSYVPKKM